LLRRHMIRPSFPPMQRAWCAESRRGFRFSSYCARAGLTHADSAVSNAPPYATALERLTKGMLLHEAFHSIAYCTAEIHYSFTHTCTCLLAQDTTSLNMISVFLITGCHEWTRRK
jgi:hypothetical protein